jgi:hypothetical protein
MSGWTAADVEQVAQAAVLDLLPPSEIMDRLGLHPPDEFFIALGRRVLELKHEQPEHVPFVVVGNGEQPPWGDDRSCPICGVEDLPLQDSIPPRLTFISHCGHSWVRGPIKPY